VTGSLVVGSKLAKVVRGLGKVDQLACPVFVECLTARVISGGGVKPLPWHALQLSSIAWDSPAGNSLTRVV